MKRIPSLKTRILSLLLCLCMVYALLPAVATAESDPAYTKTIFPHSCFDGDGNDSCDYCGMYGLHKHCDDNDGDGVCDLCIWESPGHAPVDRNRDFICEICNRPLNHEYTDKDGDFVCDICSDKRRTCLEYPGAHNFYNVTTIQEPTCTQSGLGVRSCMFCGIPTEGTITDVSSFPGCTGSEYVNSMNKTFPAFSFPYASRLTLHFSDASFLEENYDKLYVYSGSSVSNDNLVAVCTGSLKGKTITVNSGSFTLVMVTDSASTAYGFELDAIDYYIADSIVTLPPLGHNFCGEPEIIQAPTCTQSGLSIRTCVHCGITTEGVLTDQSSFPSCTGSEYTNNMNKTFSTFSVPDASNLVLHFSDASFLEKSNDKLYVYSGSSVSNDNLVAVCTGSLKDKTVTVNSDSFTLVMVTDGASTAYGFEIDTIDYYFTDGVETLPPLGHDYDNGVTKLPTCTEKGYTTYTCILCGDSYTASHTPATGHSYDNGVEVAPTCTEYGHILYTCQSCGHSWKEYTGSHFGGHTFDEGIVTEGTCTERGYITYTCIHCGITKQVPSAETTQRHSLSFVPGTATCTEAGTVAHYHCSTCGKRFADADAVTALTEDELFTAALGHNYLSAVTPPTAAEQGYTTYTCTLCGSSYQGDFTDALGVTLSGSFATGCDGEITLELLQNGSVVYSGNASGKNGNYRISGILPGNYILRVSKLNHTSREYALTVDAGTTQDVDLWLIGDLTGDCRVNMGDVARLYSHIRKTNPITDAYQLLCANINGGNLNVADVALLYSHILGTNKLY